MGKNKNTFQNEHLLIPKYLKAYLSPTLGNVLKTENNLVSRIKFTGFKSHGT